MSIYQLQNQIRKQENEFKEHVQLLTKGNEENKKMIAMLEKAVIEGNNEKSDLTLIKENEKLHLQIKNL